MKSKSLTILVLTFGLLLNFSCQTEEKEINVIQKSSDENYIKKEIAVDISENWQHADLSRVLTNRESNYLISVDQLRYLVSNENITQIRFIPGISGSTVLLKIVGADRNGDTLTELLIKPSGRISIRNQLSELVNITFNKEMVAGRGFANHIIQPAEAFKYVNKWYTKSMVDINELTSYQGERIRYFSLGSDVVSHLANLSVEYINVSWGLNNENKLTTVLIPVSNNSIQIALNGKVESFLYDFLHPCPNTCNNY